MNQHTRGPWEIHWGTVQDGEGHSVHDSHNPGNFSRVANVVFHEDSVGETRANVRIIAAAPEMYEFLTELVREVSGGSPEVFKQKYPHLIGRYERMMNKIEER